MRTLVTGGVRTFISGFEKEVLDKIRESGKISESDLTEREGYIAQELVKRDVVEKIEDEKDGQPYFTVKFHGKPESEIL